VLIRLVTIGLLTASAFCQVLEEAKRAFDVGDYRSAARLFERAHQQTPQCEILFYLGVTRYRLSDLDRAIVDFQRAVQCDPKLVSANVALGEAYSRKGNESESLSAFTRALDLDPHNGAALRGASAIYLRHQVNEKAVPLLEHLAVAEPGDPSIRADLGAAYAATGDRDGAEQQFRVALRLDPKQASALVGLANLQLKKGEEEAAIALLRQATRLAPKASEPRFLLGSAYNRLRRHSEAIEELEAALRFGEGDSAEVYYHLARAYGGVDRTEDRKEALARFAEITRKSKQDTEAQRAALRLVEEAKTAVEKGDLRGALALLEEARPARPGDALLLFRLASLHFDLRQFAMARDYAQEAISLAPSAWVYHFLLGLIEKESCRPVEARSGLEAALKLNPQAAEIHNALGELALLEGNFGMAIAGFRRAVELAPDRQEYRANLEAARAR
jgi:tetratricopeptide (TPR) repeat protein